VLPAVSAMTQDALGSLQIPVRLAPPVFIDHIGERDTADWPEPAHRVADRQQGTGMDAVRQAESGLGFLLEIQVECRQCRIMIKITPVLQLRIGASTGPNFSTQSLTVSYETSSPRSARSSSRSLVGIPARLLGRNLPAIVKNDLWWLDPKDPHRVTYVRQGLFGPTLPTFWTSNPAYAQVQNEHVWQTDGRDHSGQGDGAGRGREGVQAGRGDLREIPDHANLNRGRPPTHSRNAFTGRTGLKRVGHGAAREMACAGPERLKHFALGYGGDGCTIAKQSPAG